MVKISRRDNLEDGANSPAFNKQHRHEISNETGKCSRCKPHDGENWRRHPKTDKYKNIDRETIRKHVAASDQFEGGLADNIPHSDFDQDELKMGIEVELEHTEDKALAEEIATDHLVENPRYYTFHTKFEEILDLWDKDKLLAHLESMVNNPEQ